MEVRYENVRMSVAPGRECVFGRGDQADVMLQLAPDDATVSRRAGRLIFDDPAWRLDNIGRRSFFLIEAGAEIEIRPSTMGRDRDHVLHHDSWIRIPSAGGDHAIELIVPNEERPDLRAVLAAQGLSLLTDTEDGIALTDTEHRSVVAVYEGYLQLPPYHHRSPASFRAAAHRLGVEEGKVKADLRRVQDKVTRAGGPDVRGPRYRDALIQWLMSRQVVCRADLALLSGSTASGD